METFQEKIQIALQNINPEEFVFKDCVFGGDDCVLVCPYKIGVKWSQKNKYLRSVIYRKSDFYPVSLAFPKFVNWGENLENFPVPTSLEGNSIVSKIDGSLISITKYKGEYIIRTRGTSDCSKLLNKDDYELIKNSILQNIINYLEERSNTKPTWDFSHILEYVSPQSRIVLNYGDFADFYYIGCISHKDYSLFNQKALDLLANVAGFKRPEYFTFNSITDLINNVHLWKGKEGVCFYSKNDQEIHKLKSQWYLELHKMKSEFSNIDNIIDVYLNMNCPSYTEFEDYIVKTFDWEIFSQIRGEVSRICNAQEQVTNIIEGMFKFINNNSSLSRKDFALKTVASYGDTNRASFIFTLLDKKKLSKEQIKKLLYQCLKK